MVLEEFIFKVALEQIRKCSKDQWDKYKFYTESQISNLNAFSHIHPIDYLSNYNQYGAKDPLRGIHSNKD